MSAFYLILLLSAFSAAMLGGAALATLRGLRRQLEALRAEHAVTPVIPAARAELRQAVIEALADERERELAEARAFWAAQEARESGDARQPDDYGEIELPRIDLSPLDNLPGLADVSGVTGVEPEEEPDPAPWHPSHAGFAPAPVVADQQRTADRLQSLADAATTLEDLRSGPLGTVDLYIFSDGSTLCISPSDRPAADRLTAAIRTGSAPTLLGGSGIGDAYALTFGGMGGENVYVLADRVVASW